MGGLEMKIYLTRHGQTQWNIEKRLQGWGGDSPLTEKGIIDAKLLRDRLEDMDIDIIYSSTSGRAITTAEIIRGGEKDIEIVMNEALKEMDIGSWQGRTLEEIRRSNLQEYHNYWHAPPIYIWESMVEKTSIRYKKSYYLNRQYNP